MITEIPTATEFHNAALNQIYLAWQIAIRAVNDYDQAQELTSELNEEETATAAKLYWEKSQPVLANAFSIMQQAMELALKGRIAAISPFLLIARDPKEWPSGVDKKAIPFSDFRTLDAADLVKVHNTFSPTELDDSFRQFWDGVRRDRNKLMHSVSAKTFDPAILIRSVLTAVKTLFDEKTWPETLLVMEAEGKYAAYGLGHESDQNVVMDQINTAISYLKPAENMTLLDFNTKRRSYICPICLDKANRDWQDNWPALAQLTSKSHGSRSIHCIICRNIISVERIKCINPDCKGDVICNDSCLSCLWQQDFPINFSSGLSDMTLPLDHEYDFSFKRAEISVDDSGRFANDASAVEHARRAMNATYLQNWQSVVISGPRFSSRDAQIGKWIRKPNGLEWEKARNTSHNKTIKHNHQLT